MQINPEAKVLRLVSKRRMFERDINGFKDYRETELGRVVDVGKLKLMTINQLIYPTIFRKVNNEHEKAAEKFNQ